MRLHVVASCLVLDIVTSATFHAPPHHHHRGPKPSTELAHSPHHDITFDDGVESPTTATTTWTATVSTTGRRGEAIKSNRRDWLKHSASVLASMLLIGGETKAIGGGVFPAYASIPKQPQTFVITGANSGIGYEACKRLVEQGHTIVLACRTMAKATDTASKLGGNTIPAVCDLASMSSIRAFSEKLPDLIAGTSTKKIDALCLNAGIARNTAAKDVARTEDGFELTVGINHFGHFYMNSLLLPMMNEACGRIVVTASGVHDPESPGGAQGETATLGDLSGLEMKGRSCEMIDGAAFNADKAYKDSKLCNVLFTKELQKRLLAKDKTKQIVVNCFNPGLIVSTGLFRDQNKIFTKAFDVVATDLLKVGESPTWGGGCLAYVTTVDTRGEYYSSAPGTSKLGDSAYGSQFAIGAVSREAQDVTKARRLWELTEEALGMAV